MIQLVTGGSGFIGSCYVLAQCAAGHTVINLDKLSYSGNPENLRSLESSPKYHFVHGDIGDADCVERILTRFNPDAVINFAAESHVDRSILDPDIFVRTNVLGTATLLRMCHSWWQKLPEKRRATFRFLHVSTDEVFGTLQMGDPAFDEKTPYAPNSPYAASKASSDLFVRAFHETYGFPTLISNCSNNYGPRQFPEKLIPLMILNALAGKNLPVYGTGTNIRDWLHVEDHCDALAIVLEKGIPGEAYAIGGGSECSNLDVVRTICRILDAERPDPEGHYERLIRFVTDRLGHDFRYAIDAGKMERELHWKARHSFDAGIVETVRWYLANPEWTANVQSGAYREWLETNYQQRR